MAQSADQRSSILMVEECFNHEDGRFLEELRKAFAPGLLAGFVDRWKKDPRPWARQQIFSYLDLPLDRPGHNVVVKRLFQQAEQAQDDQLMAAFLVAFDRLVRRLRKMRWHYDWNTRESWQEEFLKTPRNSLRPKKVRSARDPRTGTTIHVPERQPRQGVLFSYHTRYYLRRRAWRYFRNLGYHRGDDYPLAVAGALRRYRDTDLAQGENLLDSWGLMHACFDHHEAIEFSAAYIAVKEGHSLAELQPAPYFPHLWKSPAGYRALLSLVTTGAARLVRTWAMQLLRREHGTSLTSIATDDLLLLLDHHDPRVQQFGAELLQSSTAIATAPLETWLRLLKTANVTALEAIAQTMLQHVSAEQLSLEHCIELACTEPAPVARLGLSFLKTKPIDTAEAHRKLVALADARCAAIGGELGAWALSLVGRSETYDRELVIPFFDSLLAEIRAGAWDWLVAESPGRSDAALWCRLLETPFDEMRLRLVDHLERRSQLPGADAQDLAPLWCAVLSGVHRGGRQKARAAGQIARAIEEDPARADLLLPVLAVAIRSVRGPELRAGLTAVVTLVTACPEMGDAVSRYLPELDLSRKREAG